jgi:hypothetical protein
LVPFKGDVVSLVEFFEKEYKSVENSSKNRLISEFFDEEKAL